MKIAFVGLGRMGAGMTHRLLDAGHEVHAWNRSEGPRQTLASQGGKPAAAKVAKRTVRGLPVTTIDVSGDYSGMGGPMASSSKAVPGYRLLGAIVEGSGGNIFLKFTGPAKTIDANAPKFDLLVASFRPDR